MKPKLVSIIQWLPQFLAAVGLLVAPGCHEGPLWQTGKWSPWSRQKWAAEEQAVDTLFEQKREMTAAVDSVVGAPVERQEKVALALAEAINRHPVLLLRLHAVQLVSRLRCPATIEALESASTDPSSDIRVAAIRAWQTMPSDVAIGQLQNILGSDTNVDVRLAATRALGSFSGRQAIEAISLALDDPDPALQMRAAESLATASGERFGRDIVAWQNYVAGLTGVGGNRFNDSAASATRTANQGENSAAPLW